MTTIEKLFSVFAIVSAFTFVVVLILLPESRQLMILIPLGLVSMTINIGLMFVVLKDIFFRPFPSSTSKYVWIGLVLLFWPSILYYLPKHGFRKRQPSPVD